MTLLPMYVLRNKRTGKYVAKPGSARSFTDKLESAMVFRSVNEAEANACGDETAVAVDAIMGFSDG